MSRLARAVAATCLLAITAVHAKPAGAEVRFGSNVFIGGYDFSHRRYRSVTIRQVAHLPGPAGCRTLPAQGDRGGMRGWIERCNLPARR